MGLDKSQGACLSESSVCLGVIDPFSILYSIPVTFNLLMTVTILRYPGLGHTEVIVQFSNNYCTVI